MLSASEMGNIDIKNKIKKNIDKVFEKELLKEYYFLQFLKN